MSTINPRIYVACLAAYNNGHLHGAWIDAAQDPASIQLGIQKMLSTSPISGAEEWAIHDVEFEGIAFGEFESIETVATAAKLLEEHGQVAVIAINYQGGLAHLDSAEEMIENYRGEYDSLEDWAEETLNDQGALNGLPENLRFYFDFASYARDCELNGDIYSEYAGGKYHVFFG